MKKIARLFYLREWLKVFFISIVHVKTREVHNMRVKLEYCLAATLFFVVGNLLIQGISNFHDMPRIILTRG